jgi:uncharacterized protein (TIGR03435 family)
MAIRILNKFAFILVVSIAGGLLLRTETISRPQAANALTFEVASLKPDPPGAQLGRGASGCHGSDNTNINSIPLGRCVFTNFPMSRLMLVAFPPTEKLPTSDNVTDGTSQLIFGDVSARGRIMPADEWITGAPGWFNSDTFTINAKAENPETTTQGQLRLMLQSLVKERFKLEYHLTSKVVSGYFIVATKDGIKLKKIPFRSGPTGPELRQMRESGVALFPMQAGSIIQLAIFLTGRLKVPVIDTINGVDENHSPFWYDFSPLNGTGIGDTAAEAEGTAGSLFTALPERAGLKLEAQKIPVKVFVIDHVEKPSAN